MENHDARHEQTAADENVVMASSAGAPTASQRPSGGRWLVAASVAAAFVLVMGPVIYLGLPEEISRWYVAAAMELQLDGDTGEALQRMERAESWSPENPVIYAYRGDWKLEDGDYRGSLDEYNRALRINNGYRWALVQRSQALQHLGRHEEAIADWKRLLENESYLFSARRATTLNGLAYAQALGKTELESALENVEQALRLVGQNAAMLDTRGFIHYQRGDLKSARSDLELAVRMIEDDFREYGQTKQYIRRHEYEAGLRMLAQSVAVIRYHRALVYEGLDKPDEAEKDLQRVRELGFAPGDDLF
jgi:tetratricopeptide (TPR) repeat protein